MSTWSYSARSPESAIGLAGGTSLLDRRLHEVPPFRPGAVVVLHVRESEEVLQDEPGVGGPLADPAIGDDLLVRRDTLWLVESFQLFNRLECPVLVPGLRPRTVL